MPVKDGREATQDIRMWEQTHSVTPVPIIGVTAHALVGDREKCMKAGVRSVSSSLYASSPSLFVC
jgi:osomolarity two-component system sensor histidine kinase NIK1